MRSPSRLGCLTPTSLIVALITVLVVTGATFASGGAIFSPGGLNARQGPPLGQAQSHADLSQKCEACHTAPWDGQTMTDRCLACHTQIQADMQDPHKMHGALMQASGNAECRDCHTEHHGAEALITRLDIQNFPHEITGFSLKAHAKQANGRPFTCDACHGQAFEAVQAQTCAECHTQISQAFMQDHRQAFGMECRNCHDGVDAYGKAFDHSRTNFKLEGQHGKLINGRIACQNCHENQVTLTAVKETPIICAACHLMDDAHQGRMGTDCATCHTPEDWAKSTFDHNVKTSFKLVGKHLDAKCQSCHTQADLKATPADCASCHSKADPHQGKLGPDCQKCHSPAAWTPTSYDHKMSVFKLTGKHLTAACADCHKDKLFIGTPTNCAACHSKSDPHQGKLGTDCQACHTTDGWKPSTFDHSQSAFKLTGSHTTAACAACHKDKIFAGTPSNCAACHSQKDAHQGKLGAECQACHTTTAWKPSTFDHSRSAFKLVGAHQQAACTACHQDKTFKGAPTACVSCHSKDDTHRGSLGTDCALCHSPAAWKPSTFNHARSAFPLTGSHAQVQCGACHANQTFKGTPTNCFACHSRDDRHNGQFGQNCSACHTTNRWSEVTFNHNQSGFPLTGAHAQVQCSACHANGVFKGTPANCFACHAGDDHHNGQFGQDCAGCHVTASWSQVTFDHNRSGFPLTGAHASLPCQRCHSGGFSGTPTACAACHGEPSFHAGLLGSDCAACHSTSAWRPAKFNGSHTFPMQHGNANSCQSCHPSSLNTYTCYTCHNQNEIVKKHQEKNISDLNNCVRCHANGKGD